MLFEFLSQIYAASSKVISTQGQTVEVSKAEIYFPPKDNPTNRIVELIDSAQTELLIQAYNFNISAISEAVSRAHKRGVRVLMLMDKSQIKDSSDIPGLSKEGLEIWIDHRPPIAHNKVIVIDKKHIVHGSFNYSKLAHQYAENCMVYIDEPKAASIFTRNIYTRLSFATKLDDYLAAKKARAEARAQKGATPDEEQDDEDDVDSDAA